MEICFVSLFCIILSWSALMIVKFYHLVFKYIFFARILHSRETFSWFFTGIIDVFIGVSVGGE